MSVNSTTEKDLSCSSFFPFSKYNLFSFGDVIESDVDWVGRGAVGGNATFYNFGIGKGINCRPNIDKTLIVGGNLQWNNGANYAGNTIMTLNGQYKAIDVSYTNTSLHQPVRENTLPLDFKSAYNYANCLSKSLSKANSDGNTLILNCYGNIKLIGDSPKVNIFNINPNQIALIKNIIGNAYENNQLDTISGITIVSPKGSTNIINVSGDLVKFGDYSILRNTNIPSSFSIASNHLCNLLNGGSTPTTEEKEKILWNFCGKNPTIIMSNMSLSGSILAPNGNLKAVGGNIEGNVIVNTLKPYQNNLQYHTELHNFPFNGCIPKCMCYSDTSSVTESISKSISGSASSSVTESISESTSGSASSSVTESISESTSGSASSSITESISESTSGSATSSVTESISKSISGSATSSVTESISKSISGSSSSSVTKSISKSISESTSSSITSCCCSCIEGHVWCECNCNCICDCNEKLIPCVLVVLYDSNFKFVNKTVTDECGYYCLCNICPGQYNIVFYFNNCCYFYSDPIIISQNNCKAVINLGL